MWKQVGKTIFFGVISGAATAFGAWIFKKYEPKADLLKQEYDRITKNNSKKKED